MIKKLSAVLSSLCLLAGLLSMSVNAIEKQWLIDYANKNQVDIDSIYLVQSKSECSVFFDEEYGVCLK